MVSSGPALLASSMSAASWSPAKARRQSPSSAFPNFFGTSSCSSAVTALLIRESDRSPFAHSSSRRVVLVAEAEITALLGCTMQCRSGVVTTRRLDATARKPTTQKVRMRMRALKTIHGNYEGDAKARNSSPS